MIQCSSNTFIEDYENIKHKEGIPILQQIETHAKNYNVTLDGSYKVELAKRVKSFLSKKAESHINKTYIDMWQKLFNTITEQQHHN
ncbi:MAG: hypothetical protein IKZ13_08410 [Akkermansia sp.]|nr:hypothetical protein [Akkermansia sp.]